MRIAWLFVLLTFAFPAGAQPIEVISGQDLVSWQEMEQRRLEGDEAVASYRKFIQEFPTSPLAEVAWTRLRDHGQVDETWTQARPIRPHVRDLRMSWEQHQRALSRTSSSVVVAKLDAEVIFQPRGDRWGCPRRGFMAAGRDDFSPWRLGPTRCR